MVEIRTQNTKEALKMIRERIKDLKKAKIKISKNATSVYFEMFEANLPITLMRDILNALDKTGVEKFTHYRKDAKTLCIDYGQGFYALHSLEF